MRKLFRPLVQRKHCRHETGTVCLVAFVSWFEVHASSCRPCRQFWHVPVLRVLYCSGLVRFLIAITPTVLHAKAEQDTPR